jgi:hypothetical protein
MPHRFEHALIVLRDLRRSRNDLLAPGKACHDDELQALGLVTQAIKDVEKAQRLLAARDLREQVNGQHQDSLITEALRHLDWQRTRRVMITMSSGMWPRPEPTAALRAED